MELDISVMSLPDLISIFKESLPYHSQIKWLIVVSRYYNTVLEFFEMLPYYISISSFLHVLFFWAITSTASGISKVVPPGVGLCHINPNSSLKLLNFIQQLLR